MMRTLAMASLVALTTVACSNTPAVRSDPTYEQAAADRFLATNGAALDRLVEGFGRDAHGGAPILVATIVDINDLRRAAPLGRSLSEQYASRLVSKGFNVKELKLRGDVFVQEGTGELLLSREIRDIARSHSAVVVLVGTYSPAATVTYINLKLVRTEDGRILRAHDYALPNDRDVLRLMRGGGR